MYIEVWPEFLPEYVLQMYKVCRAQIFMHPARSEQSEGEVILAYQFNSLQHHHVLCFITFCMQCTHYAEECEPLDVNTLIMDHLSRL
jgi:hypothetical protein